MSVVNPSLFAALGKGFTNDAYAVDGNHLRWQFDPRLGFPRFAFCIDHRASVVGGKANPSGGAGFADLRLPAGSQPVSASRLTVSGLELARTPSGFRRTTNGVELDAQPIDLRFVQFEGHACYVRLSLLLNSRVGAATVEALYDNRGQLEVVDRASRRLGRRFPPIGIDLDELDVLDLDERRLSVRERLLGQLAPVAVTLEVWAPRIDRLRVFGSAAVLQEVSWVRSEALATDKRWKPVECVVAATEEPDYQDRNQAEFAGRSGGEIAKDRIVGGQGGPVGAEPLDDFQVPPSRPATDDKKARRYLSPWVDRLEPWLAQVLSESLGGAMHQSEVAITADLDDAGQERGAGIPDRLSARRPRLTMRPYPLLLAAAMSGFPTARLLGLGFVHRDPGEGLLDYRIRGRWLVEDLQSWVTAGAKQLDRLVAEAATASPVRYAELQVEIVEAQLALIESAAFVAELTANAVDGVVELVALVLAVQPASHPLFSGPADIDVAFAGLGLPPDHSGQATAAVDWTLRQRARVIDDTQVPTGACIVRARGGTSGPFEETRNPNDPSDTDSLPVAILPAGPPDDPGAAGIARFVDRYVDDGAEYRYGVSECDPFGRWSPITETEFRWDDLTPPAAPVQVEATLDETGGPPVQTLTITFAWPAISGPVASTAFELHLRRTAPPSGASADPVHWGEFERIAGSGAPPLSFGGGFAGGVTHDAMNVTVGFADETRPTVNGTTTYRVFTVVVSGVVVPYDANDRARAWVAVGARNTKGIASAALGGPALAEDFRVVPPPPPVYPPEPQLATYPDADRLSTFRLTWSAGANVRATVYRAGERELVAMAELRNLPVAWNESDPTALRSAAVRAVAPALRDAFQPVSGVLPSGTTQYTDQLVGAQTTLSIYTVVRQSPALVPGPWPGDESGFVAVAVPKIPEPSMPLVVSAAWSFADAGIEVEIAELGRGTAPVGAIELYRVFEEHADRARDIRLMRPVGRFPVSEASYADRPSGPPRVASVVDTEGLQPWRAYLYRVVARGAAPGRETRSQPSAALRVLSYAPLAPDAPVVVSAVRNGLDLEVEWTAVAPTNPVGHFRFAVFDAAGPITLVTVEADGARDAADPQRFRVTIANGAAPDGPNPADVTVQISDPLGRSAVSDPLPVT